MNFSKSVLIVDDNAPDRYLLKRHLKAVDFGGEVFEASDGEKAFEFLKDYERQHEKYPETFPPCVIFLDINMPILDGYEFLQSFSKIKKNDERYKCVKVMIYSSLGTEDFSMSANDYDFVDNHLVKGEYSLSELRELLQTN